MKPQLQLRQTQSLVMTPQLQQAIKLLQMSNLELGSYVAEELERNPLLAAAGDDAGEAGPEPAPDQRHGDMPDGADSATQMASDQLPNGDAALDTDYANLYEPDSVPQADGWAGLSSTIGSGPGNGPGNAPGNAPENDYDPFERIEGTVSLRDHLLDQIGMEIGDNADRPLAVALVDWLDDAGYLSAPVDEIAVALNVPKTRVEAVLAQLQGLDPAGVFARDLRDCLAIQLKHQNRYDPMIGTLLDHLPLLADGRIADLQKRCGCDADDLAEMLADIRRLDPKPAAGFGGGAAQTVIPDIITRPDGKGGWLVELNSETLPRLLVDRSYHAKIAASARNQGEKSYLTSQLSSANWLLRTLDQRANTILRTATEIVRQQEGFLKHGIEALRPLTLRAVAEAIDMHESTISRVTSNKFIATPRGVFELKFFFTVALGGDDGDAHSAESVRHRIRALIEAETIDKILSDDALVTLLQDEGIEIARRTVAKYREAMGIPSSAKRRRSKRARLPA